MSSMYPWLNAGSVTERHSMIGTPTSEWLCGPCVSRRLSITSGHFVFGQLTIVAILYHIVNIIYALQRFLLLWTFLPKCRSWKSWLALHCSAPMDRRSPPLAFSVVRKVRVLLEVKDWGLYLWGMNDSVSGVLSAGQACTCDIVEFPALMTPQSHLSIRPTTSSIPAPTPGNPAYYNLRHLSCSSLGMVSACGSASTSKCIYVLSGFGFKFNEGESILYNVC